MPVRVISQRDGRTKTRLYQIYTSMKETPYSKSALQTFKNNEIR